MIKIQEDDFEILHCSFPRTGTQWIRCVVNDYLTEVGFKYKWDFSHCVSWHEENRYVYEPMVFALIPEEKYVRNSNGVYRHYFYTHRLDYKRVSYSNLRKIINPSRSTKWYAKHFLEVYMQHSEHIESIISKHDYPWVTKSNYEDFLNDPVNKFSEAIGSITLQNVIVDKDILNKTIENWSDKNSISRKTEYHNELCDTGRGQNYRKYLEPDYEEKYEEFLNNHGTMLDEAYESTQIRNT